MSNIAIATTAEWEFIRSRSQMALKAQATQTCFCSTPSIRPTCKSFTRSTWLKRMLQQMSPRGCFNSHWTTLQVVATLLIVRQQLSSMWDFNWPRLWKSMKHRPSSLSSPARRHFLAAVSSALLHSRKRLPLARSLRGILREFYKRSTEKNLLSATTKQNWTRPSITAISSKVTVVAVRKMMRRWERSPIWKKILREPSSLE